MNNLPVREQVFEWLAEVPDPEIPVLSILDLGIVRDVVVDSEADDESLAVTVTLTPTYSGCPATEVIESDVHKALKGHGVKRLNIRRALSPPWTTDWISESGKEKLRRYGISPPVHSTAAKGQSAACPICNSIETHRVSEFGSTACKSAWRCGECLEPFEVFKCI